MKERIEQSLNFNFQAFLQVRNKSLLNAFIASINTLSDDAGLQDWLTLLFTTYSGNEASSYVLRYSTLFAVITNLMSEKKEMTNHTGCIVCAFYLLDALIDRLPSFSIACYCDQPVHVYLRQLKTYLLIPKGSHIKVSLSDDSLCIQFNEVIKEIQLASHDASSTESRTPFAVVFNPLSGVPSDQWDSIGTRVSHMDFEQSVSHSLSILQRTDPLLHQNFLSLIDLIVSVKLSQSCLESASDYNVSFSLKSYIGAIFLSYSNNDSWLVETLVHEFAHNLLNTLMLSCSLISDPKRVFYSPWKEEPRPAYGLLHALFAFTYVESFLIKLLPSVVDQKSKAFIKGRLLNNSHQLKLAFDQPLLDSLTDKGKKVYHILQETFFSGPSSNFLGFDCPKLVLEHKVKFMQ